jgi:hypothetical protein
VKVGSKLVVETPKTKRGRRIVMSSPDVTDLLQLYGKLQQAEAVALGAAWPKTLQLFRKHEGVL